MAFSRLRPRVIRALVYRDYLITTSYRFAFFLDLFFGLVNLVVYFYISRIFTGVSSAELGGAPSYFAFAAVGVSITVVVQAASAGLAQRLREEQLTGTLEALHAQPVNSAEIAVGLVGFPFAFAVARAAFYLLIAALLLGLDVSQTDWPGFVLVLLASATALASIGMALGALVLVFKRGEALTALVTFALGFLGGAFFPLTLLPDAVEPLLRVIPTRFAFDGVRAALFQGRGWTDEIAALLVFSVMGLPAGVWAFSRALLHGRRSGTLAQY